VAEAQRACSALARRQKAKLITQVADDLPLVPMDRGRMLDVLRNLIENALQHSPAGAPVTLTAGPVGDSPRGHVALSVGDQGPGFGADDMAHVFEPFFTRRRGGTGLGLSIVHRIVEQHGGSVSARNQEPHGAVVTVTLPLD
jgi:signal transduction histidine kinase